MSSGGAFDEDALAGLGRGSKVWVSASACPAGETRADETANARRDVEAYLPATVVRIGDRTCEVKVNDEVRVTDVPRPDVFPANPAMLDKARDLTSLSYLNEPSILRCVRDRYAADDVYTDAGPVLVAVNPFKDVSETLYGDAVIEKYVREASARETCSETESDPHVYKVVVAAYRDMLANRKNQALVVSGESGAGKTETTKIALRCLAKLGRGASSSRGDRLRGADSVASDNTETLFDSVESVLLSANPAFEAFGNAKTARNDNSSRFGKLVEVGFDALGAVRGARVQTYLLEKTRVVGHAPGERAYHAFYQLVAGASPEEREAWHVADDAAEYKYLVPSGTRAKSVLENAKKDLSTAECAQTGCLESDAAAYEATKQSLRSMGISNAETRDAFRVASATLWLGNVTFEDVEGEDGEDDFARVAFGDARAALKISAKLLGVRPDALEKALTTKTIAVGGESVTKRRSAARATETRDALAKATYASIFEWLVRRVNERFATVGSVGSEPSEASSPATWHTSFAVLDIYGFETFERNSFEQLCINYANERLQQRFNAALFSLEQAEYEAERIDWTRVAFEDNQKCVDVIDGKKGAFLGVLPMLDEQCAFPKATDATFARACAAALGKEDPLLRKRFFAPSRRDPDARFTIAHYAGDVEYDVSGFLAKNKDEVPESALELLETSKEPFAVALAAVARDVSGYDAGTKKKTSVGARFKTQLAELVARLDACAPRFIRCVKPNETRAPDAFHDDVVLAQMRCCGVLEVCRIARLGYPTRWPFAAFVARFGGFGDVEPLRFENDAKAAKAACRAILEQHGVRADEHQLGVSKVFLRAGSVGRVEDARARRTAAAATAQRFRRGAAARRAFLDLRRAATKAQAFRRGTLARFTLKRERAVRTMQAAARGMRARAAYRAERAAVVTAQMAARRFLVGKRCLRRRTARETSARLEREFVQAEKFRRAADAESARTTALQAEKAEKRAAEEASSSSNAEKEKASLLAREKELERERVAAGEAEARAEAAERLVAFEAEARARLESEARAHRAAAAAAQAELEAFRADAKSDAAEQKDALVCLERENASLRARLAAETDRADSFRDRLLEAESEWAGEMAALQAALAAVRAALESGEPPDPRAAAAVASPRPVAQRAGSRGGKETALSGVSEPGDGGSLAPSPGTPEEARETRESRRPRGRTDAKMAPVRALADELATRARVFEDDAEFIVEVREGVAEADLVPLAELRRLGARFESWKRDYKERLRETRAVLRRADERDADAEADVAAIARDVASAMRVASSPRRDETGWTEVEADKRAPEKKRRGWGLKRALGLKR